MNSLSVFSFNSPSYSAIQSCKLLSAGPARLRSPAWVVSSTAAPGWCCSCCHPQLPHRGDSRAGRGDRGDASVGQAHSCPCHLWRRWVMCSPCIYITNWKVIPTSQCVLQTSPSFASCPSNTFYTKEKLLKQWFF